ncbi:hypothetical protein ES703_118831 [subsurface metagenome]
MSQIRQAKVGDSQAFPGSAFVINNTPPIAQCQESQTADVNCTIATGPKTITKIGAWAGLDLAGKKVTVTNTLIDDGEFNIISNTDDVLTTDHSFGRDEATVTTACHDNGQAYLTRNESSFTRFIENQGNAHTTKGGQLFTDLTDPPMDDACSDTWNPN